MIFSRKSGILFNHISRTGGSAIRSCLLKILPDSHEIFEQHGPLGLAESQLGKEFYKVFKFAFVRNPWDRFVSWYSLIGLSTFAIRCTQELKDPDSDHWKQFDSFLECWGSEKIIINGKTHLKMSQWDQLSDNDGKLLTDDIGRFEYFDEDVSRIFKKIRINTSSLPVTNPSSHLHYSFYYSEFGRELVADFFHKDVEQFNYQFDNWQDNANIMF